MADDLDRLLTSQEEHIVPPGQGSSPRTAYTTPVARTATHSSGYGGVISSTELDPMGWPADRASLSTLMNRLSG